MVTFAVIYLLGMLFTLFFLAWRYVGKWEDADPNKPLPKLDEEHLFRRGMQVAFWPVYWVVFLFDCWCWFYHVAWRRVWRGTCRIVRRVRRRFHKGRNLPK